MGLAQRCGTLLKRIPPSNRFASASPRISATHRRSYSVGNGASGTEPQSSLAREQDHKVRPYFAQKQDNVDELHKQLSALVGGSEPWKLTADGKGLEKSFRFASANVAIKFMNIVFLECDGQRHHPEWANSYSKVFVRWTTHRWVVKGDPGLSIKDLRMARFCDEIAVSVGRRKLTQDEREGFDTLGKKLLERVESGIDDRGATA
ncbi:hypothetical protein MMC24_002375 [Lignoscripta atroalba]|nr:hypothetical protein [Lignoscripta atroalba]